MADTDTEHVVARPQDRVPVVEAMACSPEKSL